MSDGGAPVAVVEEMPDAPVVPVLPAAGGLEKQTFRGFLVEAGVLYPTAPSMT